MRKTLLILGIAAVVLLIVRNAQSQGRWSWPEQPENLEVLPEGTGGQALAQVMRGFSIELGVRCWYCHVGEEGQPLSAFDFASDENPNKDRAREMLRMVDGIEEHLAKIEPSGPEPVEVGCYTCHRGVPRPVRLEDELLATWKEGGVEAMLARYRALREQFHGRGAYDFGERTLIAVGSALLEREDPPGAVQTLEFNTELFPESSIAWFSLGGACRAVGESDRAIECYETSLRLDPRNRRAQKALQELRDE